jgi:xylan 1,4-beta-xylosidase
MFGMMGDMRVEALSDSGYSWKDVIESGVRGEKTDVGAIASKGTDFATVMFWNYHDDDKISPDASIELDINGIPAKKVKITQFRIDKDHSNSYEVWKKMGSPQDPSPGQYAELGKSGMLGMYGKRTKGRVKDGAIQISTSVQRQGVGLLIIEWK